MEKTFFEIRKNTEERGSLIHSITSPIAINDCANVVLSLGAKPIMAEHPREVEEITAISRALTVSYANITDARMESIFIAGYKAKTVEIPCVIDAVGVTCSSMRMEEVQRFIHKCSPTVIKGNISEIKALAGMSFQNTGIDVGKEDILKKENKDALHSFGKALCQYSQTVGATIVCTGEVDVIANKDRYCFVYNGSSYMAKVTGTGCILTCILGVYLGNCQKNQYFQAVVLSLLTMGIAGELAEEKNRQENTNRVGMGSYHITFLDSISLLTDKQIGEKANYEIVEL